MYLTIQLVLYTVAFVLFAWQLCTWRRHDVKRPSIRQQRTPLLSAPRVSRSLNDSDSHPAIERAKSDLTVLRGKVDSTPNEDCQLPERTLHYLS